MYLYGNGVLIWKHLYETMLGKNKDTNSLYKVLLCGNESMYVIIYSKMNSA